MNENLQVKVNRAIKLIQSAGKIAKEHGQPLEVAYSGGKDSDVILELTKMSGVEYRAIYKNTTIDPAGTIKHAQEMGAEIIRPKKTFFEIVSEMGFPNRFRRFCCGQLKEYKILDYAIIGVRREESVRRSKRYNEPEECRVYSKNKKARHYFPILDWTNEDVREFIEERGVKCAPVYYDEQNMFHVERRLGCVCCCLKYKNARIEDFKIHPNMVKAYIRAGKRFLETHPDSKVAKYYGGDVYEWFVRYVFYDRLSNAQWDEMTKQSLLPPPNYREFLENYFGVDLKCFTKNKV